MSEHEYEYFVGIDWATESHAVCVLDRDRNAVVELEVMHNGDALAGLVRKLETFGSLDRIAAGIEIPRGAVVETLVDRGVHVYALNPKQLDRSLSDFLCLKNSDDRWAMMVVLS